MSVLAAANRLRLMRKWLEQGRAPAEVWTDPPPGYVVRRQRGPKGVTYCWHRPAAPRGAAPCGPCCVDPWTAVRLAWQDWEQADRRLI